MNDEERQILIDAIISKVVDIPNRGAWSKIRDLMLTDKICWALRRARQPPTLQNFWDWRREAIRQRNNPD